MPNDPSPNPPVTLRELFFGFAKIGLMGFGGIAAPARHIIVAERRWLTERDYAAVLGVGHVLPGANIVNASIMIGDRFCGVRGSLTAFFGLMFLPLVLLLVIAGFYDAFAHLPDVKAATMGAAAAAAGTVAGTGLKMARNLKPGGLALMIGLIAFITSGVLRLPLVWIIVTLAPLSVAAIALARRPK